MRNAFRNSIRTFSIVLILGLSIGLALAMLVARASVSEKIQTVKSSIGNTITISPAGSRGFEGGGEPLTTDQLAKINEVDHITGVTQTLNDRLNSSNTSLVSSIEAGTLGNRQANNNGVGFQAPPNEMSFRSEGVAGGSPTQVTRTFTPPVTITGTNALTTTTYGGDSVTYTAGEAIDTSKDEDIAVVGKALAEKNSLSVGSTFTAYDKTITVKGIYDTGNTFSNNGVIMSLASVQRLSGQTSQVTTATAVVDSIDNIESATSAIESALGDAADVTNNQESAKQAVEPLESVKTISTFSLIGAVIAGAVIILLTMVMIVRERRREIGVYKAIGASNLRIMLQFTSEALTLTVLAMIVGLIIGAAAANPLTKVLVNNSSSTNTAQVMQGPGQGGGMRFARGVGGSTLASARSVQADVGLDVIAYGVGAAALIAVLGSALPALMISKIRPAEVMRAE